ncbi:MAG: choice-of-anchor J domain-containing protein, partial [Bacteroidales bacterium]|nr:choice-of-anchor J domain-containing protein [Bacteroidales bacterium]
MIRRFLLLILPLAFMLMTKAQSVIIHEGFDDGQLPEGWTVVDYDGDGYNWDAGFLYEVTKEVFSGTGMISSASHILGVGALEPDNWLISPAVVVPTYAALSFHVKSQDEDYPEEYYSVYVSTVKSIEGFLQNAVVSQEMATAEWEWKTVDLSEYAGETVYIAFRHHNSSDMYWLDLDEVSVVGGNTPFMMTSVDMLHCDTVALGSHSPEKFVSVRSFGLTSSINASVTAPFTVSVDGMSYSNSATLNADGGTLYVRYTPTEIGEAESTVTLSTAGLTPKLVDVDGLGVNCDAISLFPWTESFDVVPPPCWNLIPEQIETWTSMQYLGQWWASCVGDETVKTEQLETGIFDFSAAIHPVLCFNFLTQPVYVESGDVDLKVYVSLDGGNTYLAEPFWSLSQYGSFEAWIATAANVDLLSLVGETSVKLKFSYEGHLCQLLFNEVTVIDLPATYSDRIIYVKTDAAGDGSGSSWENAMTMQLALQTASHLDSIQVWVAAGTYYGDTSLLSVNAFVMPRAVSVYGGFVGNEPANYDLSQRDLASNVTILDGKHARRVLYQPSAFGVQTCWDGFTIQNGRVEGNGAGACLRKNGVLRHCKISHNKAGYGGGVYAENQSALYNCLISNNEALRNGGGIYMNHLDFELVNSTIVKNLAEEDGCGVYGNGGNLVNCIVWGNKKGLTLSDNIAGTDLNVDFSAIEGGYVGEGNIALGDLYNNPMFVSPSVIAGDADTTALVDWHLQEGSVCVNRGGNELVTDIFDLDGITRIKRDTVDMGCYESDFYSVPNSGCVYQTVEITIDTCDEYTWNGHTYAQTGDYTNTFMNADGCDSVVTLHLTVNYTTYGDTTAIACDSFDWYEHVGITQSCENLTHVFTNEAGCDSIVTLHLTVNNTTYGDTSAIACDSFDWYEHVGITQSCENLTHVFTNEAGCDSIVTLHLTVNNTTYGDTSAIACDSFDWYEHVGITQSCEYLTHVFTNEAGCDSIVTLHLTVNYSNTGVDEHTVCDSLRWIDGILYTSSTNTPTYTLTNAVGCDSVVTLNLTVNHSNTGVDEQTVCDSLRWIDGILYTSSTNTPTYTLTNAAGCDSVVTLNLTVNHSNTGVDEQTVCDSLRWIDGILYTSSTNTPTYTLTNAAGCDSVVTLHLTVNYTSYSDTFATAFD